MKKYLSMFLVFVTCFEVGLNLTTISIALLASIKVIACVSLIFNLTGATYFVCDVIQRNYDSIKDPDRKTLAGTHNDNLFLCWHDYECTGYRCGRCPDCQVVNGKTLHEGH